MGMPGDAWARQPRPPHLVIRLCWGASHLCRFPEDEVEGGTEASSRRIPSFI